ncbi:MAG: hypothetical protein QNJ16_03545 [Rhodobacter sp.]|nr:hypothetical protein [Rhodobacter sp.]
MEQLMPVFRGAPVAIFLYGFVSSTIELMQTWATVDSLRLMSEGEAQLRILTARAFVFSLDNLFFYTGLAALVAFAIRFEQRNT